MAAQGVWAVDRFVEFAGEINVRIPQYVIERLQDGLNPRRKGRAGYWSSASPIRRMSIKGGEVRRSKSLGCSCNWAQWSSTTARTFPKPRVSVHYQNVRG